MARLAIALHYWWSRVLVGLPMEWNTYNCYTVIIDVCVLVEFVLEFCVFGLGDNSAGMQTWMMFVSHVVFRHTKVKKSGDLELTWELTYSCG